MNRRILIALFLCWAALAAAACTIDETEVGGGETPSGATVAMRIPLSRGGDNPEETISKARVIIYTVEGGQEKFYSNELLANPGETYVKMVPVGKLSVYLIANEFSAWNLGNIGGSSSPANIKGKVLSHIAYPVINTSNTAPMFGFYERFDIDKNGNTMLNGQPLNLEDPNGTVRRLYSKVSLSINCEYADLPEQTPISLSSVAIKQMPKTSYLAPAAYSGDTFDGAAVAAVLGDNYILTGPAGSPTGFSAVYDFYVPEYIVSDVTKGSYILINAYMTNRPGTKMTYKLMLGDAMWQGPDYMLRSNVTAADLTISRNTHYTVSITKIKGFGDIDAMDVYAEAAPWIPEDINSQAEGRKLNVSHLVVEINKYLSARVHFWSDRNVEVEPTCVFVDAGTEYSVDLNSFFLNIPGSNFHFSFSSISKTGSGYMDLEPLAMPAPNEVYEIRMWLNAEGLRRQIIVKLINKSFS